VAAQQERDPAVSSGKGEDDDGDLAIESQLTRRRAASAKRRRPLPSVTPAQQTTKQAKEEPASQTEALVLQSLGVAFALILLEGLILAASGFLPEEIDNFIVDYIYPTFSIQVGVVFACSTVYGLWKTSATKPN
jgi:hypothetical protein